jgi:hypothetical protein
VNVKRLLLVLTTTPFSLSIRVAIEEVVVRSMPSRFCAAICAAPIEKIVRTGMIFPQIFIGMLLFALWPEILAHRRNPAYKWSIGLFGSLWSVRE